MSNNFSHQTNTGTTVNVVGDHTVVHVSSGPHTLTENIRPDVRRFFESLKERYQTRYQSKLDGRFEITLEVSESLDSPRPQRFIERYDKDAEISAAFVAINNTLERKGRLLITGNPGVGKTVLILKLAINLLNNLKSLDKEPFPVVFNLALWSPAYRNFGDWLTEMLVSGYGLSKDFAATLLQQERIIFLLDGLDELARNEVKEVASERRAQCLASLNEYLREGRRAIISCRIDEFRHMQEMTKQQAPVLAKIEVLDLSKAQVLLALTNAENDKDFKHHTAAKHVLELLETEENEKLLEVISTPFYFTTAMDVFDEVILNDKQLPKTPEGIRIYLIEKFIDGKLNRVANPNNFERQKAIKWLKWLAQLRGGRTVTFELTDLQPNDLRRPLYFRIVDGLVQSIVMGVFSGLVMGIFFGTIVGLCVAAIDGYETGTVNGLIVGSLCALGVGTLHGTIMFVMKTFLFKSVVKFESNLGVIHSKEIESEDKSRLDVNTSLSFESMIYNVRRGQTGLLWDLFVFSLILICFSLAFGVFSGVLFAFCLFWAFGISKHRVTEKFVNIKNPYQRLLSGIGLRFLICFFIYQVITVLVYSLTHILEITVIAFLLSSIYGALVAFLTSPLCRHLYLRFCLYLEGSMPLKYATFLDYVTGLRILERDGGQWGFRHQNLQEYFAKLR